MLPGQWWHWLIKSVQMVFLLKQSFGEGTEKKKLLNQSSSTNKGHGAAVRNDRDA